MQFSRLMVKNINSDSVLSGIVSFPVTFLIGTMFHRAGLLSETAVKNECSAA